MIIRRMFAEDINRPINGVIKVDQGGDTLLEQEVREYVITRELKKHFITFFNYYSDAFTTPTSEIGVWISGFFGSGKSHFLKMLSYILENREVCGKKTVEYFRDKFSDDPATFMMIDQATRGQTETILFDIDIEGPINKNNTAVLRVFAKMFYNHLGFYGEDLKVAKLEQFIEKQGKTAEFRRIFEEKNGGSWLETRESFAFFEDDIVETLQEVLGMSETAAHNWFNGTETVETSIAQVVSEIKDYVKDKPDNFRLLFMIDEVGQYVGTDTNMLLNLQSLVEKIGTECGGKVWVMCTGQEAIDEIIKVRADEFSRIQARFKTRLSLTSSSADEVIQKRILKKTDDTMQDLELIYNQNDSVLRNLFSFTDSVLDIKGFSGPREFAMDFPFVPYQFILMQKVFNQVRKHGNVGKHTSGGERSMLSGFQEAAQKIQEHDEYALAPFFLFYDTVHTSLDSSIRRVIERCQNAADNGHGIEQQDVDVLKLLYLVRYVDDVKANLDNIVILMADDIRTDKITMREQMRGSLDRLLSQNYIARTGDTYNFLTDEEQDIQREIKNTPVDTSSIVNKIYSMIFADIYTTKKYRYGKYDFAFDQMVDGVANGAITGGMRLRFLTVATDQVEKNEMRLMTQSQGKEAIVVLADTPYYESLENAMKIRKYVKQRNVAQLPKSVQDIIRNQQDEASKYEAEAAEELVKAIEQAAFYVDGEHIEIRSGNAKSKIEQALEYLVSHVYSELTLITKNADSDADVIAILNGSDPAIREELEPNYAAAVFMEEYLEMQAMKNLPTSMADIQSRYSSIPYGWREIDIAAVAAHLVYYQKVTIKYAGATIQPDNPKLPDMLRKKSEIGKTSISKRIVVSATKMKEVKEFLRDFFYVMDVPDDEDGLIRYIVEKFNGLLAHYEALDRRYEGHKYPDRALVSQAIILMKDILSQQKDNIALVGRVIDREDNLYDSRDALVKVEEFFDTQVNLFDEAVRYLESLRNDMDYLANEEDAHQAMNQIRLITLLPTSGAYNYKRIPELNGLIKTVRSKHDALLEAKREEVNEIIRQCMAELHGKSDFNTQTKAVSDAADRYYTERKTKVKETKSLALLDGLVPPMLNYKDDASARMDAIMTPPASKPPVKPKKDDMIHEPQGGYGNKKEIIKAYHRQIIFSTGTLKSEEDVDAYLANIKDHLMQLMEGCDGIKLN